MNTQKVALTIPKDLVTSVDDFSRQLGVSRSRYITMLLEEKVAQEKKSKLKNAYDAVFSDDAILREQLETAGWFEGAGEKEGQKW